MKRLALGLVLMQLLFAGYSQDTNFLSFHRKYDIPVQENLVPKDNPWIGGLNSCQFSEIDMNLDGIKDLLILDRVGDFLMPFINGGTAGSTDYTYAPEYAKYFPQLRGWAIFKDYDGDGKNDIFASAGGGVTVYRNISDTVLKFEMKTYHLYSFYYLNYVNIYATNVDLIGLYDIDMDGDLDILSFIAGYGTYVEFHRNMSMELFGVPDSLEYKMETRCWGRFYESETSNELTLNAPCPFKNRATLDGSPSNDGPEAVEHVGSTFLLMDANGDSLADLILGDVDYPNVVQLINGGTLDSAHMISQDTNFPNGTLKLELVSFPALSYIDIDNDGVNELLASPFDPSPILPENYNSVWLYENNGQNNNPQFNFVTNQWMQGDMIDLGGGAYPVIVDENADGLPDIIAGNYGYRDSSWYYQGFLYSSFRSSLTLFRNVGTLSNPAFEMIDRDYANVTARNYVGAAPAFADLDNDGDLDMMLGKEDGTFAFYRNSAGPGQAFQLNFEADEFQNLDVGKGAMPQLIDLDGDLLLDLASGNMEGTITYFKNTGTANSPVFTHITDSLGAVDVRQAQISWSGYSAPTFFRDSLDSLHLMIGSNSGLIAYYNVINIHQDSFNLVDAHLQYIYEGQRAAPALGDLDNDGFPEMIIGNYRGGLSYYKGVADVSSGLFERNNEAAPAFRIYPNPATDILNIVPEFSDGLNAYHLSIFDLSGRRIISHELFKGNSFNVDVSRLDPGAYMVQLSGHQKGVSRLFIKK